MARPAVVLGVALAAAVHAAQQPNFVVIETDDQDYVLGSLSVMPSLRKNLIDRGTLFTHSMVTTPICCPSRTSMWTSRYAHNLQDQSLGWCGTYPNRSNEGNTWVADLKAAGYSTYMAGKYHNDYAAFCGPNVHIPPQFDSLFAFCLDSQYFNISYNSDGVMVKTGDAPSDYMTSQIGNHSVGWIGKAAGAGKPFFAYIGTHAPHVPATVAPWYDDAPLPATIAPRTPNWNLASPDKHYPVSGQPDMTVDGLADASDAHFQRRLRSLLSVDDIVTAVVDTLAAAGPGVADNTYLLFTSDHGYNLGQYRLPVEKFHVYENDIRVPLIIAGPGIPANSTNAALVANIDLGQTVLDLAGLPVRQQADGRSYKALALGAGSQPMSDALYGALTGAPGPAATDVLLDSSPAPPPIPGWRDTLLIEYWSMGYIERGPCHNFSGTCPGQLQALVDAPGNTYVALRVRNATYNSLYAEFRVRADSPYPAATNWTEAYDIPTDPYQTYNLWPDSLPTGQRKRWQAQLWAVVNCTGQEACP